MSPVPRIRVAAGILSDEHGNLLLAERLGDSPFAGFWEFPGGKLRAAETPEQALVRELREELGIDAYALAHFLDVEHEYVDRRLELSFFRVGGWHGIPAGLDGQRLRWLSPRSIDRSEMMPANMPVLDALAAGAPIS